MSCIFLVGFMASGKSAVGALLAKRLDMSFVDLDTVVEDAAGTTIAEIFATEGEAAFRVREREALAELAKGEARVVATGGGTACKGESMELMRQSGTVVHLATELETAMSRVEDPSTRPLLAQPAAAIEALYRSRQPAYRRAHLNISTDERSPEAVVDAIEAGLRAGQSVPEPYRREAMTVALGERSYPVIIERGGLAELGSLLVSRLGVPSKVAVISDDNVAPIYGAQVQESLARASVESVLVSVASGEGAKSIESYAQLCEELIAAGLDRKSAIVALGGGVVGDLAGFVAASLFRGISVVQVPTTVLAMTDSAIGGKTGINSEQGKNLIGAFWQPSLVLADPDVLTTLPVRERRAAFGELVKYALLDDALMDAMADVAAPMCAESFEPSDEICDVIRRSAAIKVAIVSTDERERGLRATLNLGHTLGHAIEKEAGPERMRHGEAVALGLIAACRVSHAVGLCDADLEERVRDMLVDAELDVDLETWLSESVFERLRVDKKRTGNRMRFIALSKPGDVRLHDMDLDALVGALRKER